MNCLPCLLVCILWSCLGLQAHAERWILKNPTSIPHGAQVIKSFRSGEKNFVVVEMSLSHSESSAAIAAGTQSEAMFPDLRIGIPAGKDENLAPDGWHVRRLRYGAIPADLNGRGVVVAVLDSGVDYNHPALAKHIWINGKEIPGNGKDDDHNGYVDDVRGYDFVEDDNDPMDIFFHGTHCAGVIAADWNHEVNSRGIARGVKIMPVKILEGQQFLSTAIEGIYYAVDNGAKVLSNSWRIYQSWSDYYNEEGRALLAEAIRYAASRKVIFVAAAGNENMNLNNPYDPIYPAGMKGLANMVVVGATNEFDARADYSNYGNKVVHVAAPGSGILSTVPGGRWEQMSGTSMATPIVAGLIAIGFQKGYSMYGSMDRLMKAVTPLEGFSNQFKSGGLLNVVRYLK